MNGQIIVLTSVYSKQRHFINLIFVSQSLLNSAMKKASNKIPMKSLKDSSSSSNKQMKGNKFSINCIQVVKIHFTKLKINSGKRGFSMNKFPTHKKNLPRRGLDGKAVKKDKKRPKRIMKKRKL